MVYSEVKLRAKLAELN